MKYTFFSLHKMKEMAHSCQKLKLLLIIYSLKLERYAAKYDIKHDQSLLDSNNDVA